eukprot:m.143126 g.143126  ORF g.143126 m.143126 type:complete len:51 (-) comp16010_c0_seq3:198-350(-)
MMAPVYFLPFSPSSGWCPACSFLLPCPSLYFAGRSSSRTHAIDPSNVLRL